jgi:muramoyltetrapeptide carboxypeptidase
LTLGIFIAENNIEKFLVEVNMVKPEQLKKGDRVAIIAPSTPADPDKVGRSEKGLRALGLEPVYFPSCFSHHGHLAGTDDVRLKDIHDAFGDTTIKGIICLKGGSGATRLLDKIDYGIISRHPKVFVGYSDITALHMAFQNKCDLVTFHGPMALSDMYHYENDTVEFDPFTYESYHSNLFGEGPLGEIVNPDAFPLGSLVGGQAEGQLVGGNLSLLISTLGSPYEIDTKGKILFIEEVHESAYVVDRMLCALALAGKFRDCAGIILGTWTDCIQEEKKTYGGKDLSLEEIFEEVIKPWGKPTITGLYAGHNTPQLMFPLGVHVKLDADLKTITITESPYKGVSNE